MLARRSPDDDARMPRPLAQVAGGRLLRAPSTPPLPARRTRSTSTSPTASMLNVRRRIVHNAHAVAALKPAAVFVEELAEADRRHLPARDQGARRGAAPVEPQRLAELARRLGTAALLIEDASALRRGVALRRPGGRLSEGAGRRV
ncbi:hypothetical protein ACQP00_36130 [Dactylosporangium sp. CS-047395]|uniref:hypothetical protein n=1 Tax=Dactylosporangium sp. CS-047395 TaxID=3239936 RepID=UPI003D8FAFCB